MSWSTKPRIRSFAVWATLCLLAVTAAGCRGQQTASLDQVAADVAALGTRVQETQAEVRDVSATAEQALQQATAAQERADQALEQGGNAQGTADQALEQGASAQETADQALQKAAAAQETADQALALIQQPMTSTLPPAALPAPGDTTADLARGFALTYEREGQMGMLEYPVSAVYAYSHYLDFLGDWDRDGVKVELAWSAVPEDKTWHLEFTDRDLGSEDSVVRLSAVQPRDWYEYLVYVDIPVPSETEPNPASSNLLTFVGPLQPISGSEAFGPAMNTVDALVFCPDEDPESCRTAQSRQYVHFLLTDASRPGEYLLAVIVEPYFEIVKDEPDVTPPDDRDSPGQQSCGICVWGWGACGNPCW